jgi:ABC-type lipoprotein export system ATPase subunit
MTPALDVRDAFRLYRSAGGTTVALQGLTLSVEPGEIVAVLGPSGSGKTTLLRALAGFEPLSAGSVYVFGQDLGRLGPMASAAFRAANVGFVDQHYSRTLSPDRTCRDSVALHLQLAGEETEVSGRAADALLGRVGLADRGGDRPPQLSGGEQQRVAVCAAVAHRPRLILADEPAGELDAENAEAIYHLLGEVAREADATAVIVTHDAAAASVADRLLHIRDGRLVEQSLNGRDRALVVSRHGWVRLPDRLFDSGEAPGLVAAERSSSNQVVLRPVGPARPTQDEDGGPPTAQPTAGIGGVVAELRDVSKSYGPRTVLSGLNRRFEAGRLAAVVGRSGSGKTTLLYLLAGLERPTDGEIVVSGATLMGKDRSELAALRRRSIGLVAQAPSLVPYLSARENVLLGLGIRGAGNTDSADAEQALADVGLAGRFDQRAATLSAGELQRVAIARALAAEVELLLVDEPTARLDEENGRAVGALLARAARERGIAVVCATHDPVLIGLADDVLPLEQAPSGARS